jgi:hypothetical protein
MGEPKTRRLPSGIAQERRLSYTRLTSDDEDRALAASDVLEQPVQRFALTGPAPKRLPTLGVHLESVNDQG